MIASERSSRHWCAAIQSAFACELRCAQPTFDVACMQVCSSRPGKTARRPDETSKEAPKPAHLGLSSLGHHILLLRHLTTSCITPHYAANPLSLRVRPRAVAQRMALQVAATPQECSRTASRALNKAKDCFQKLPGVLHFQWFVHPPVSQVKSRWRSILWMHPSSTYLPMFL